MSQRHLRWLVTQDCCVPSCQRHAQHAHHVRTAARAGTALLPPDEDAVPLCAAHHIEGHHIGWRTFERKYDVDLTEQARFFASASGTQMP